MESDELPLVVSRLDDFEGHGGYSEPSRHRRPEPDSARHTDRRSIHRKDRGGHSRARDSSKWAPEYPSSTSSHRHYPQSSVDPYDRHSDDYRHHGDDSHNERWPSPPGPSRYSRHSQSERTREWEMDHHSQSHPEHYYDGITQPWDYSGKETYGRWPSRRDAQASYDEHRSESHSNWGDMWRQAREARYLRANWDRESMPPQWNGNPAEGSKQSSSRSWDHRHNSTQSHNQQRSHHSSSQQYPSSHSQHYQYENKHRDWRHDDGYTASSSQNHSKKKKRKHNHSTHHHQSKGVHDPRGHSSTLNTNYDPPEVSPSRRFQKNERTRLKEQSRQHRYDYSRSPSRSPSRSRSSRASSRHDDSRRQSRSRSVTPEYRSSRRRGTKRPRSVSSNPSAGSHRSRGRSSYRSRAESRERSYSSGSSRSRTSSPKKRTVHRLPGAGDKTINQQRSHNISTLSTDRASLAAALPAVARSSLDTPAPSSYLGVPSTEKHMTPMAPASFRPSQPISSVERIISTAEGQGKSNFGSRFKPINSNEPSLLKKFFPGDEDEEMEDVKSTDRATSRGWQRIGPATTASSDHSRDAGTRPSEAQSEPPPHQPVQLPASSKLGFVLASSSSTTSTHPLPHWDPPSSSPQWDFVKPQASAQEFEGPPPEPTPSGTQTQPFSKVSQTAQLQKTSVMQAPISYPSIPPSPRAPVQSASAQEVPLPCPDKLPKGKELYQIVSQVGEGTFGKVFKAENVFTGRFVALKRIRMEQERDGFPVTAMREIKLLQSLKHPNVINLHEMMVSKGGSVYMVFEYMDHDLTGILSQQNFHFTDANLKSLCQQMLAGIAYLHQKAVIHRDMKGSNILINNRGILKIADFGLARFYQKRRRADYTNRVITLWYRPPELLLGATVYGPEVDMWSVGCIMLELYVKKPVFQGVEEMSQLDCIYQLMGTPCVDEWPGFADLPWYELVKPAKKITNRFRTAFQKYLSSAALDLAQRLLEYDPVKRITAAEALEQPFFTTEEPRAALPVDLASLEGEWHEYESKIEREKRKRKQRRESGGAPNAGTNEPLEST